MLKFAPLLLLLMASANAIAAPGITAEQAVTNYRKVFKPVRELDCPRSGSGDEIVVCGRSGSEVQPGRLPLPVEREPGEIVRLAPGEAPPGEASRTAAYCFSRCPGYVGLDIQIAKKVVSAIKRALEGDDE